MPAAGFLRLVLMPLALALAIVAGPAAAATDIGVTAAVKNDVKGGGGALSVGSKVFQNEIITTGVESLAQLMFLDETTLSLGPKSQVTLDKFVFDPSQGAGSVVFSATKGAFRFITGSQDPRHYTIKTPVATIGVRGTIVDCYIVSGGLACIVEEGTAIIGGHTVAAGQAIFISSNGTVTGPMTPDGSVLRRSPGNDPVAAVRRRSAGGLRALRKPRRSDHPHRGSRPAHRADDRQPGASAPVRQPA